MAEQLTKILELSALPNVVVQVLPFKLGAHPALESNFTILGLPNSPEIVFVEGLIGSVYLEHEEDLRRYREIFNRLKSIVLSPEDTANVLAELRDSYRDDFQVPLSASAEHPWQHNRRRGQMSLTGQEIHGLAWRKASHSANDGACVEVALVGGRVAVRDSKNPGGNWLRYPARTWQDFISIVKGEGAGRSSHK